MTKWLKDLWGHLMMTIIIIVSTIIIVMVTSDICFLFTAHQVDKEREASEMLDLEKFQSQCFGTPDCWTPKLVPLTTT